MIKLRKIIIEQTVSADIAFHIAEVEMRESIEKHGLNPTKYPDDITTSGENIYIFLDYDEAVGYTYGYNDFLRMQGEPKKSFDVWQIDISKLKIFKDYELNTGEDPMKDSAYMTEAPINKRLLKLIKTI